MASVTFDHVYKRFGDVTAVSDLNVSVADREFLVFVGPSGCGKTTSLRMLAGLEEISDGQIYIGDRVVNDVPPKDRDIAMVFQSYALYPHMSVYDNMAFGLKLRKMPKNEIDQRVRDAARRMGIEHLLDRKPKQLSGGQRQRVAVCRAIVRNPAVFLMDEPLSNLDAKLRVQARAEISKLHQQLGTTFIYVTHDQTEAMTMGTRIAVMKDGVLQQIDTPQTLYDKPDNIFVAGFIGSPSMNLFDSTVTNTDGALYIDTGNFRVKVPPSKMDIVHDPEYLPSGINTSLVESKVDVTELMGNEVIVYLENKGKPFLARVDPRTKSRVGNTVTVAMNMDNMHMFDKQTEKAVR
jgi:multiple sugar transport system ATP-binding protein